MVLKDRVKPKHRYLIVAKRLMDALRLREAVTDAARA